MSDDRAALDFLKNPPPVGEPRFWEISPTLRLAWNEYGAPDGFPILYYHGWPSSRLQARLTHHLARERGLRIVAMDRPGMGKSTFVPGRTLDSWPELMEGFTAALGIGKFGQLAVSGGGPYALACAARFPDRLSATAVLAGAVPLGKSLEGLHWGYRLLGFLKKTTPCAVFTGLTHAGEAFSRLGPGSPPVRWLLGSVAREDRRVLLENPEVWTVIAKSFREGVQGGRGRGVMADADVYFQSLSFDPAQIRHPVRYWHGGDDQNIRLEMVREFVGKIAGAELVVDESLGHFSLVIRRAPEAMDYLAEKGRVDG
jgi:pimeloyl-ACP methyl ester carboxylesterase